MYYTEDLDQESDLAGRSLRELTLMRNTIYARAGNPFRKKWLHDYFSSQSWYHPLEKMDEEKLTPADLRNADSIAQYDVLLTREELVRMKDAASRGNTPENAIELRLLSARLGEWLGPDDPDRTPLEDPKLLDRQVTVSQLSDFSRRDLRMLRNLVYARRGRPFQSELLQKYFETINWYKADPVYSEARLTDVDRRNINVIRSVEDQLGGPLADLQQKKEDGWFGGA